MTPGTARLSLAAAFPAFLAGEALAQARPVQLPSPKEVGRGLAAAHRCVDRDGSTLCDPLQQPVGADFRQILCVEYGSDADRRAIVRCVYKGARLQSRGRGGIVSRPFGDGAIDLIKTGNTWLPHQY